jgi:YVTN family beta-propeller protein
VTNIYEGTVAVIDLGALEVIARIAVGDKPNGVSFSTTVPGTRSAGIIKLPLHHDGPGHR